MSSGLSGCGREVGNGVYEVEILSDLNIGCGFDFSLKSNNTQL